MCTFVRSHAPRGLTRGCGRRRTFEAGGAAAPAAEGLEERLLDEDAEDLQ
jgi:hypothetical protein